MDHDKYYRPLNGNTAAQEPQSEEMVSFIGIIQMAPTISLQPLGSTIDARQQVTLSVTVRGSAPFTFQWYRGPVDDYSAPVGDVLYESFGVGAALTTSDPSYSSSYTTPPLYTTTSYWVLISNDYGKVQSQAAVITVNELPAIVTEPAPVTIVQGQIAQLKVSAAGAGPITYQWYQGQSGNIALPVKGATSAVCNISGLNESTYFWAQVTNPVGSTASRDALVTVLTPPKILSQSPALTLNSGQSASLRVSASGTAPLSYQWYQGQAGDTSFPVLKATGPALTTLPLKTDTLFWVSVTNEVGTVSSTAIAVRVIEYPAIITPPGGVTIDSGQSASLRVIATGTAPLSYQWYHGNFGDTSSPVEKATDPELVTPPLLENTLYWVRVTNTAGSVDSQAALVTVKAPVPEVRESEVALRELGESIAATIASVQSELNHYPNALGAFMVSELELNIPVHMRVDNLGQVRVTVADQITSERAVGQVRLMLRPVPGASQPPLMSSGQSLASLGVFSADDLARLHEQRIFSVDDLLNISRNEAGRSALTRLGLSTDLNSAFGRAALLNLPGLPPAVAQSLLKSGITNPDEFIKANPNDLAQKLSRQLNTSIEPRDVAAWQHQAARLYAIPLPPSDGAGNSATAG